MYKPKVLVVEDDPAITNLIRTTLETQDYQYHTAKNGTSAIMDALSTSFERSEDGAMCRLS